MSTPALLVIDLQNDYFDNGQFPLWNANAVKDKNIALINAANASGIPVFLVQHIADPAQGLAPFFNEGTQGAEIHSEILEISKGATRVVKHFADSFLQTELDELLKAAGVNTLYLSGMMTQNCITHTALSKSAEHYQVHIIADACTTQNEMLHLIALNAIAPRIPLTTSEQYLAAVDLCL